MKDTNVPVEKWDGLVVETTERLVIEYANLSGRESANRATFRMRAEEIISQAIQAARIEAFTEGQQSVCAHSMWKKEVVEDGQKCKGCGMVANDFPMVGSIIIKHQ